MMLHARYSNVVQLSVILYNYIIVTVKELAKVCNHRLGKLSTVCIEVYISQ